MLLDGAKRISLLIAFAAFGWIAVHIVFNEKLWRGVGNGAHASAFLALLISLTALISAFYFRRLANLSEASPLARWRVARSDWDAFALTEARETEESHRATLVIILGFAVLIPAAMALTLEDARVFAAISLGIMVIGGIGYLLRRNVAQAHLRYRNGVVSVSDQGVLINGVVHGWRLPALAEGREPERALPKQTAALLAMLAAGAFLVHALPVASQTSGEWRRFKLDEASVATPPGWRAEFTEEGQILQAIEPHGGREVRVWWWFPDEPLLGYPHEIAHDKVTVAGQPALRVHHRFEGRDAITVTLDKPRNDGKRLHILFEASHALDVSDPALLGMVSGLTLATAGSSASPSGAVDVSGMNASDAEPILVSPIKRVELGNIAAVASGPRKKTTIEIHRPIFVRTLTTYHWNDARGRTPGVIALLKSDGTEVGRWAAWGKPGQGGVPNAYWEAAVNQRLEEGNYVLTTSSNETWATNAGVGWRGFYVMEYQVLAPAPTTDKIPDETSQNDASADDTSSQEAAQQHDSILPAALDDPTRPLKPGETQDILLYDGGEILPPWAAFQGQGGSFKDHVRIENGALRVRAPQGSGWGLAGLYSERAILWLDSLRNGGEAVLTYDFDSAETTGFLIGLSTHHNLNGNDPSNPRFLLHWRKTAEGASKVSLVRDYINTFEAAASPMAPKSVRLVIAENGVRVEGEGLPRNVTAWADLSEAQGFRIYAMTRADKNGEPVSMALKRITLTRRGGAAPADKEPPAPGVDPLPSQVLFDGKPSALWQTAGLHADQEAKFVTFRSGAMIADVPEKQQDWAMAGLLSNQRVLRFNERIAKTPYRLIVTVDPRATTGLRIVFSDSKVQEMWGGMAGAFRLIRRMQGDGVGKHHLQLRTNSGPYAVWDRAVSSAFLDRNWDGRIVLTFGNTWATAELPGIVSLRGTTFNFGAGASKYMTIFSEPEKEYQPSRLVLRKIEGGWVTPVGMTAAERWTLVDDDAFDKDRFLNGLADDLIAPSQPK